jgi:hypothetical protein
LRAKAGETRELIQQCRHIGAEEELVLRGHCGDSETGHETSTSPPGAVQNDRRILEQELKKQDNRGKEQREITEQIRNM